MSTIRNQIMNDFCHTIGGRRGYKFSNPNDLPIRAVFDESEEFQILPHGDVRATLAVRVECVIDGQGGDEGARLDSETADVFQTLFNADYTFDGLVEAITPVSVSYKFSEMGESLIGVSITFSIQYLFNKTNLSITP